jgi:hypothetical protein
MIKIPCKIVFTPEESAPPLEIIGNIDKLQLTSQANEWLTVESTTFRNNRLHIEQSIIPKRDIIQVVLLKENKRYVIDKENLALNTHVLFYLENMKT